MATVMLDNFGGIAPRVHPTLLGANMAVKAYNCLLKSGKLVPIHQSRRMDELSISFENGLAQIRDAKTIYLWHRNTKTTLLAWPGIVYVAPSNLSNDASKRIFVTGETGIGDNSPCVYITDENDINIFRHPLVKEPLPAPLVSVSGGADPDNLRYTSFIQTWVDKYGYESGASNPSNEIAYNDGDQVTVSQTPAPAGAVKRRLYKVIAGTETDNFQFVYEQIQIGGSFQTVSFSLKDEDAGEVLPTLQSPAPDLEMVCKVPNGFYAGVLRSKPREVRFSESGNPTIWPDAYTSTVADDIVGLGVTLNTVFALTRGKPYAITGTEPNGMTSAVLASPRGCVSKRSICTYNGAVFYVCADGMCMLQDGSAVVSIVTDSMFSKREWQALVPEDSIVLPYGNAIFVWFTTGNVALVINMQDDSSVAITTHEKMITCGCVDDESNKLVYVGGM